MRRVYQTAVPYQTANCCMQALPQLLTRALRVLPQLHAPLPPALANDLRTLAAYLRNYSPLEHQLLQGFVDRIEASLAAKLRSLGEECQLGLAEVVEGKAEMKTQGEELVLRHYNSCSMRNDLHIELQKENRDTSNLPTQPREKELLSQRSQRGQSEGIRPDRHKFGSRQRHRISKDAKEDSFDFTLKINSQDPDIDENERSLKFIRSQAELTPTLTNPIHRKKPSEVRLEPFVRPKGRYDCDSRSNTSHSSLKIKLKPKTGLDLTKFREAVNELSEYCLSLDEQIAKLSTALTQDIVTAQEVM